MLPEGRFHHVREAVVHAGQDVAVCVHGDVQAGCVMINEYFTDGPGSPFGGYKQSGIGRERGLLALQNYTQVKNVVVRVGGSSPGQKSRG
jgi:aldehyde dehydrogenase (NAD+)